MCDDSHYGENEDEDEVADEDEGEDGDVDFLVLVHRLQITQLEFGHAAAFFFGHQLVGDVVVVQDFEQVHANAGLVVVHIASRINNHFAGCFFAIHHLGGVRYPAGGAFFGLFGEFVSLFVGHPRGKGGSKLS